MRVIKYFLILTITILGFSFTDVQAQKSQMAQLQGIERKIFKEIIKLPNYGLFDHIAYKVDGGTVTLYGKVYSLGTRKSAERVVKRIAGVDRVINNIEDLPPSSFDNSIRYQIVREFTARGGSLYRYLQEPNPSIRIIVDGGRVTLEGYVGNRGDSRLANILANSVPNVFQVTNNLQIERGDS
jgi:hyperosmotically inducible periplasmic protein